MLQTTEETELTMPSDFRWHSFLVSAGYLPDTDYLIMNIIGLQRSCENNSDLYVGLGKILDIIRQKRNIM